MSVLVIAEPGCTAEGSLLHMLTTIHIVADAGADAYKAQWVSDPAELCRRRNAPDYERYYRWLAFPLHWHRVLAEQCHALGLQYGCTSYLPQDVAAVDPFVDFHKVSSFEADADDMWRAMEPVMRHGKPVYVGLGMGAKGRTWARRLLCTSSYPAPADAMNLRRIAREELHGLSDHSRNQMMGAFAVCAGASVIEAHVRHMECDALNPDFAVAFAPYEFCEYVKSVRTAEAIFGDGQKGAQACEAPMMAYRVGSQ